ncbi:hypothetical protein IBTHAUMO2_360003 [Nitrosopumilaceae archaeon]|nr:KAP family NTPase [Nitrosopumilus sp.]MDA8001293.1 KAP family NTPase [Alphaproteobacteria bacterium]CAI9831680.1 hypothetical protein IBTHAUMO2_360003 [Nitrosopumilaceae archaeon]
MIKPRKLDLVSDEPAKENLQFEFDEYAEAISGFLADNNTPRPFVIGINGEWGSGKTTFLRAIKKRLEEKNTDESQKIIEFSSWQYERTDIFASLLWEIGQSFDKTAQIEKNILRFGCDILSRRIAGMSLSEVESHFKGLSDNIRTIKEKLDKVVNKKTVLFIDDLDRCSTENILVMLENIKWFLTIKNMIVVIVVDMDKVEKAWSLRYRNESAKEIGRDHTEKLFQLRLSIPIKINLDLVEYVKQLTKSMDDDEIQFFVTALPPNPRKIKLALNSFNFALHNNITEDFESEQTERIYIRTLITWIAISYHHHDIAEAAKIDSRSFLKAALICSYAVTQPALYDFLKRYEHNQSTNNFQSYRLEDTLDIEHKDINQNMYEILKICMVKNQRVFNILKHYGNIMDAKNVYKNKVHTFSSVVSELGEDLDIFRTIMRQTML